MPEYNHQHLEGGAVELPSGAWRWFPTRLIGLPDNVCVMQALYFGHVEALGSTMRVRIPTDLIDLTPELVAEFGLRPDERNVLVGGQSFRVLPPEQDGPAAMWRVRGPNGLRWTTDLLVEEPLGALSEVEVVAVASSGLG